MNRADQTEAGALALRHWREHVWDVRSTDPMDDYRQQVAVVLDAVLPQITTAEQVKALLNSALLYVPVMGGVWLFRWNGLRLVSIDSDHPASFGPEWVLDRYGPLTVVWRPQPANTQLRVTDAGVCT